MISLHAMQTVLSRTRVYCSIPHCRWPRTTSWGGSRPATTTYATSSSTASTPQPSASGSSSASYCRTPWRRGSWRSWSGTRPATWSSAWTCSRSGTWCWCPEVVTWRCCPSTTRTPWARSAPPPPPTCPLHHSVCTGNTRYFTLTNKNMP